MPAKSPVSKAAEQSFETAIDRLEHIVEEMEADRMPLEQLLALYEEGTKLVKVCQDKLDAAEKRIEIITRDSAGKPETAEFEPEAAEKAAPSTPPSSSASSTSGAQGKPSRPASQDVSLF